jgi:hypothetical protein
VLVLQGVILVCTALLAYTALVLPLALRAEALPLKSGDVSPQDLTAPYDNEYVSNVLTEEARMTAERAVLLVYGSADPSIARRQREKLRATLEFISLVRADSDSTPVEKAASLASLAEISLKPETVSQILSLNQARWDSVQQEALVVLEQVMRTTIRPDDLETVRRNIPLRVSLSLSEEQAALVTEFVGAFIMPNSQYSPELTEAARQKARDSVELISRTYKAGQTIVQSGQVITPAAYEALEVYNLIRPEQGVDDYLGAGALVLTVFGFIWLYFQRRQPRFQTDLRSLALIAIIFLIFLAGARMVTPNRAVIPYLYPLPAFGLLVAILFGMEAGMMLSLVICILAAYNMPSGMGLMPYYLVSSLCGILILGPARRVWTYFRAGLGIMAAGAAMIVAFRLVSSQLDWFGIATLFGATAFNGLASASLALLLQFSMAQTLGLTTALQLLEISRSDFPLLQFFLRNAPGTYQHSLQVANLAEQAAERIGADHMLTRVGAVFHDIGKAINPQFFIENQAAGSLDTHEDLDPEETAAAIIRHVTDGVVLARKHRLPRRIDDFILEHHGTLITRYQHKLAVEHAGGDASKVDIEKFRYPGPPPQSRETAILMLADGAEARARASNPKDENELRALIRSVIETAQREGQLDNTKLTLRDLRLITESFVTTLRGTYHPRIQYPGAEKSAADEPPTTRTEHP